MPNITSFIQLNETLQENEKYKINKDIMMK